MLKKLKLHCLLFLTALTSVFALSSCVSSFFKTKEVTIADVVSEYNQDGDLIIIITFVDDAKDPISITIPKGNDGNGIQNISQEPSADGESIVVTITYTDPSLSPLVFSIDQGVSIVSITSEVDPSDPNLTIITFTLSNGEELQFVIEKPRDGKSIVDIVYDVNEDGDVVLTIFMSDGEEILVTLPNIKGDQGDTVVAITVVQSGYEYIYTFTMSNGDEYHVSVNRPATWLSGYGAPLITDGLPGDFYYDRELNVIYYKTGHGWEIQINLNEDITLTYYIVTLDLNAKTLPYASWPGPMGGVFPDGETPTFKIAHGHTFYDTYANTTYEIPIPTRDGYIFNGWYTHTNPNINSGRFTDLVSVYRNMTLYANWI